MRVEDLMKVWPTQTEIAEQVGVVKSAVTWWKQKGIPYETQCAIYFDHNKKVSKFKPNRKHAPRDSEVQQ